MTFSFDLYRINNIMCKLNIPKQVACVVIKYNTAYEILGMDMFLVAKGCNVGLYSKKKKKKKKNWKLMSLCNVRNIKKMQELHC